MVSSGAARAASALMYSRTSRRTYALKPSWFETKAKKSWLSAGPWRPSGVGGAVLNLVRKGCMGLPILLLVRGMFDLKHGRRDLWDFRRLATEDGIWGRRRSRGAGLRLAHEEGERLIRMRHAVECGLVHEEWKCRVRQVP